MVPIPTDPVATPETGFNPYDEQGPIPVRKVRTGAELFAEPEGSHFDGSESPIDDADGKSISQTNFAKVTVEKYPTSIKPIAQPQREPKDHPLSGPSHSTVRISGQDSAMIA